MKLQLNTVKRDYISSRYIPFNINRELIPLTLILMPKPDFKVYLGKTAAYTRPEIFCLPMQTQVQHKNLLKWKHNALSQSLLVSLCPSRQEHTCSNTVLTRLPCFPWVDNMSDSLGVNWAVLCVWQKLYKTQPHTSCCYLHTKHLFPIRTWTSSDSWDNQSSALGKAAANHLHWGHLHKHSSQLRRNAPSLEFAQAIIVQIHVSAGMTGR